MWRITVEMAPWLLLGVAIAGATHALLPAGLVRRKLTGPGGVVRAVAVGVPLPLCSCAVIPVGIGLKKQGGDDGAAVGFLISTPQTGVDSVLVTASLLGWPLALFKLGVAIVTGLVGGLLAQKNSGATPAPAATQPSPRPAPPPGFSAAVTRATRHADQIVRSLWVWLVVGVVVSAAITVAAPAETLRGVADAGPLASMGVALAISLPLYVCATASAPIAAALVASGLPMGAVIVFLMAGPATNVATVGAVYRGLGRRAVVVYLGTILVGSVAGGLLFERWFGAAAAPGSLAATGATHTHATPWWATACALLLVAWLARSAWVDLRRRWGRREPAPAAPFVSVDRLRLSATSGDDAASGSA